MLGVIAFRKEFLLTLSNTIATPIEKAESIEQMRILEMGRRLNYLEVSPSLPSVNEPHELEYVLNQLESDSEQLRILGTILSRGR
jgi:3-deoxy-manno-octulosonate cytidylyltransferase (CMP-KDO synthetase)